MLDSRHDQGATEDDGEAEKFLDQDGGRRRNATSGSDEFSGGEANQDEGNDNQENIDEQAPAGAKALVVEEYGIPTEGRRQDGGKLAWKFGQVGIGRGEIVHDGSLRKIRGRFSGRRSKAENGR